MTSDFDPSNSSYNDDGASWNPALRPHHHEPIETSLPTASSQGASLFEPSAEDILASPSQVVGNEVDVRDETSTHAEQPNHPVQSPPPSLDSIDNTSTTADASEEVQDDPTTSSSAPYLGLATSDEKHMTVPAPEFHVDLDTLPATPRDTQPSTSIQGQEDTPPLIPQQDEQFGLEGGLADQMEASAPDAPNEKAAWEQELALQDVGNNTEDPFSVQQGTAGDQYEFQGETTEAEAAVEEAPTSSLLQDEEEMPLVASDSVPPQFERKQYWQDDQQEAKPEDDSTFTQSFDQSGLQQPAEAFSWGPREDGYDFGEGLGIDSSPSTSYALEQPQTHFEEDGSRDLIGSDPAALTTAAPSQILVTAHAGELQPSTTTSSGAADIVTGKAQDDDIAALWKAALDDDEFLDNGDALDPSSFFGDDDAGFLDDELTQPETAAVDSAAPVPASGHQGQMQHFSATAQSAPGSSTSSPLIGRYTPAPGNQQKLQPYTTQTNSFYDQSHNPRAALTPATDLPGGFGLPPGPAVQSSAPQRPTLQQSSRSFVDRSKSGYSSPYDLPMDIVQRRRPAPLHSPSTQQPAPPPRTSSINSPPAAGGLPPGIAGSAGPISSSSPPLSFKPSQAAAPRSSTEKSAQSGSGDQSGFFADLPLAPKLKSRPLGTYSPAPAAQPTGARPPAGPPVRAPSRLAITLSAQESTQESLQPYGDLRQPERLPILPGAQDQAHATTFQQQAPQQPAPAFAATNRYSPTHPAPMQAAGRFSPMPPAAPAASARYSPAPGATTQPLIGAAGRYVTAPSGPATVQKAMPFLPRTSSPLAQHESRGDNERFSDLPDGQQQTNGISVMRPPKSVSTPPSTGEGPLVAAQTSPQSEKGMSRYARAGPQMSELSSPPPRSRTQSPGAVMKAPRSYMPDLERPTSAAQALRPRASAPRSVGSQLALPPRNREFSTDLSFAAPEDERAADPLERWRGHPIFNWAPSGALVTSFPNQAAFYAAGHAIPAIKCTAGVITVHDSKTTFPLEANVAHFPGPLNGKGKGKKKDVVAWLASRIESLERSLEGTQLDLTTPPVLKQRAEEKIVLWKTAKVLVEHDNNLDGKVGLDETMRKILLPNLESNKPSYPASVVGSINQSISESSNDEVFAQLRMHLLEGEREKAVWYAAENRLWSHAMLISSTLGSEVWKQVTQEFVKQQLVGAGENTQSLAALYEIFAGNWEESVDKLVPPSARAGLQMVSKRNSMGANAKNPLEGLDQWRETLSLIISNRSNNDAQAVAALGRLLASYGRVEAAHTCFLFARNFVNYSGADDPEASVVLLGADHRSQTTNLSRDLDAIMLTEVYEYALSLNPVPGQSPIMPYLQSFKLVHAYELAEHGLRNEAQHYCEAIVSAIKSSTRASPYYHAAFATCVEDFSRCLSQAPQTSSSSGWVSKLSSDKVSGSMWKRFNNFVAGDDRDAASATSGPGADGTFGQVAGDSPTISRAASHTDLYGAMSMNGAMSNPPPGTSPNKYAPLGFGAPKPMAEQAAIGRYAPHSSSNYAPSRSSMDSLRSPDTDRPTTSSSQYSALQRSTTTPYGAYVPQVKSKPSVQSLYIPRPDTTRAASDHNVPYSASSSRPQSVLDDFEPRVASYNAPSYEPPSTQATTETSRDVEVRESSPYAPSYGQPANPYEPDTTPRIPSVSSFEPPATSYEPSPLPYEPLSTSHEPITAPDEPPSTSYEPLTSSYDPPPASFEESASAYGPPTTSYEPPSTSYEPPSATYEPPSYIPYDPEQMEEDASEDKPRPKKSFMDDGDDDEFAGKQEALSKAEAKAKADKDADEAFRKAAEADAARDKEKKEAAAKKGGWLGGWFGKKEQDGPAAVRAKLGEESSFYFDKDLNKWVNKKGGSDATTPTATPPPPRGPGSRTASGALGNGQPGPPSGPPSRVASGVALPGLAGGPPSRPATVGPVGGAPGSGPPSRVGTPASGESAPSGPAAANGLHAPPRPPTGLSQTSSIDDLLGAPAARKGGTVKGKKKGGRYVDVMAK